MMRTQNFTEHEIQILDEIKGLHNYLKIQGKWISYNKTVPSVLERIRKENYQLCKLLIKRYEQ